MKGLSDCEAAASMAGAIAIGEASDAQRDAYRGHLAECGRCVGELGGEREIERVMAVVAQARDNERWEPDLRRALARRGSPRRAWRWGAALGAIAIVAAGAFAMEKKSEPGNGGPAISAREARAIAALGTQTAPRREGQAESLAVGAPIGVTTAFSVSVNSRGVPLRCTITKSSGRSALDAALCRAAMEVHY
ncbi:MAG TPA: hypothetical protein VMU38_02445 [Candidatus Binatia bacterium]|nr:hypothetical protein [Candidatus Binatia bacterium]